MVVILAKKEWLQEIGDMVDELIAIDHTPELKQLLAEKIEMEHPFVYAPCARNTTEGKTFVPIYIPMDAIRGIFDMTENEKKKLGF